MPPTLPDPQPGTLIEERPSGKTYRIGARLGKGGFAVCHEVTATDSFRTFAAKIISKQSLTNTMAKAKLINEIRIHRNLQHDGIVKFHHFFEDQACVYILLERCRHQTLSEMVKVRQFLTEPEVRFFLLQIVDALEYLRGQRVIHRDLKLGNLFLHDNLRIKIGDFGLAARVQNEHERKTTICGTPNYIAPEILDHYTHGHSFEVDIWSLGVIAYTLLVGHPPFETSNLKETYSRIRSNDYEYPESRAISSAARDLISRMLVLHPDRRATLPQIRSHLFFMTNVPMALPLSALTSNPFPDSSTSRSGVRRSESRPGQDQENGFAAKIRHQFDDLQKAIDRSFAVLPAPGGGGGGSRHELGADKLAWADCVTIVKMLNYSDRYGIGYLTSQGAVGVYFNDGTKIILNPACTVFVYYERHSEIGQASQYNPRCTYPEPAGLQKKATLLQHFHKHIKASVPASFVPTSPCNGPQLVYAKKWATTKRSILFALSNGVVQVLFADRSELVINADLVVRFTDKTGEAFLCHLDRGCHDPELDNFRRRLDYTKDMLRQISTSTGP